MYGAAFRNPFIEWRLPARRSRTRASHHIGDTRIETNSRVRILIQTLVRSKFKNHRDIFLCFFAGVPLSASVLLIRIIISFPNRGNRENFLA